MEPAQRLQDVIHQRVRLGILALLHGGDGASFVSLRDELQLNEGTLYRHLGVLEAAGYIQTRREIADGRPRTWVSMTTEGRAALAAQLKTMWELLAQFERRGRQPAGQVREDDRALASLFAMGVLVGQGEPDAPQLRPGPESRLGLGGVVIDSVPDGYVSHCDGPLNHYYEHPVYPYVNNNWTGGYEAARATFHGLGLRGGYWRLWLREEEPATINACVMELRDEDAPGHYVASAQAGTRALALANRTEVDVTDVRQCCAFVDDLGDGMVHLWAWFAGRHMLGQVMTVGPAAEARALGVELIGEQYARMMAARLPFEDEHDPASGAGAT